MPDGQNTIPVQEEPIVPACQSQSIPGPTVVLPSETQSREFDAKLLLACVLAEKGLPTIVGSRVAIHNHIHKLNPAIYVAKDFRKPSSRIFSILAGLGASIVAWDEEGVLFFDEKLYHERRVYAPNLAQVKELFAWGPLSGKMIASAPGYRGQPVHVFGNPRVDMLRPELRKAYDREVEALRAQFGKFILVNTNFGKLNHFLPSYVVKPGGTDKSTGGKITPEMNAAWTHLSKVFEAFKSMVVPLAQKFPEHSIIIRPHPAESLKAWQDAAQGMNNVKIVHEGPVQPWLLACEAMIHNSCTTGIEGFLLGTKVISYRPARSDQFDHKTSNDLSYEVFSLESMLDAVERALAGKDLDDAKSARDAIAENLFASLSGDFASDRIGRLIAVLANRPGFMQPTSWSQRQKANLHAASRAAVRLLTSRLPNHKNSAAYTRKRFPGVSHADVAQRMNDFRSSLNRFHCVEFEQLGPDIFKLIMTN